MRLAHPYIANRDWRTVGYIRQSNASFIQLILCMFSFEVFFISCYIFSKTCKRLLKDLNFTLIQSLILLVATTSSHWAFLLFVPSTYISLLICTVCLLTIVLHLMWLFLDIFTVIRPLLLTCLSNTPVFAWFLLLSVLFLFHGSLFLACLIAITVFLYSWHDGVFAAETTRNNSELFFIFLYSKENSIRPCDVCAS